MFCKYCGSKLDAPEKPCPHCGKDQGPLSSTNGFFGVLNQIDPKEVMYVKEQRSIKAAPEVESKPQDQPKAVPILKPKTRMLCVLIVVCTVAIALVNSLSTIIVTKQLSQIQEEQQTLLQAIDDSNSNAGLYQKSISSLVQQVENIQNEVEKQSGTLNKIQDRLKETFTPEPTEEPTKNDVEELDADSVQEYTKETNPSTTLNESNTASKSTIGDE